MALFKLSFKSIRDMGMGFLCSCVLFWHLGQQTLWMTQLQGKPVLDEAMRSDHNYDSYYVPPPCETNPFLPALEPLPDIVRKMDEWFLRLDELGAKSLQRNMSGHNHLRFFPFDALTPCKNTTCVGGRCSADTSKIICGLGELKNPQHEDKQRCIVYSIGGNNEWQFEQSMLEHTTCDIHTFDCTGPIERFIVPQNHGGRLHFHHVCLSPYRQEPHILENEQKEGEQLQHWWTLLEMQQKLGHNQIDLLKVDIEGFEFSLLSSWPELMYKKESEKMLLPMQIVLEVHSRTIPSIHTHVDKGEWKTATDLLEFQAHLMRMGYVVVVRDNNRHCMHCVEVTLIRARCPNTGVYATA